MARETKAQKQARIADDNAKAKLVPVGTKHTDIIGTQFTLIGPTVARDVEKGEEWDMYLVHNGFHNSQVVVSSAVIARW